VPRKWLTIALLNPDHNPKDKKSKASLKYYKVYDSIGFFQSTFLKAIGPKEKGGYGVATKKELEIIERGKESRQVFSASDIAEIKAYNQLECELLVKLMNALRDNLEIAEVCPDQWHGTGAIASAVLKRRGIKNHNAKYSDFIINSQNQEIDGLSLDQLFKYAYFGGRFEMLQMGWFDNVFEQDITSAYPDAMRKLPSAVGTWKKVDSFIPGHQWALYRVKWNVGDDALITPFPFRLDKGACIPANRIIYPSKGEGIYWFPEVNEALRVFGKRKIKVIEGWIFEPERELIFTWIEDQFQKRAEFLREGNSAEHAMKLAYNSYYGKTAQHIGVKPPYLNYFWSGWITSSTRAKMMRLASQKPESVIAFATDAVYSSERLAEFRSEKNLGEWEVKELVWLFFLKSGLYIASDGKKTSAKTRGHRMTHIDFDLLKSQWFESGIMGHYEYEDTKFCGLQLAISLRGENFREMWGNWFIQKREVHLGFEPHLMSVEQINFGQTKNMRVYAAPLKDITKQTLSKIYTDGKSLDEEDNLEVINSGDQPEYQE
jgi:hypothetical protein